MSIEVAAELTGDDVKRVVKGSAPKGATHFRFLKSGTKRPKIDSLKELEHYGNLGGTFEIGKMVAKGKRSLFEPMEIKVKAKLDPTKPKRVDSGFNKLMFSLLLEGVTQEEGDVYPRSKHTVEDAVGLVMEEFPEKDPESVKKMVRVKPRALERMKTGLGEQFDDADPKSRAPRWKVVATRNADAGKKKAEREAAKAKKTAKKTAKNTAKKADA